MDSSVKFGIKVDKIHDQSWSFGMCLSHEFNETYVFINFLDGVSLLDGCGRIYNG